MSEKLRSAISHGHKTSNACSCGCVRVPPAHQYCVSSMENVQWGQDRSGHFIPEQAGSGSSVGESVACTTERRGLVDYTRRPDIIV